MTTEYIVWGYKSSLLPEPYPIALTGGNLRHCRAELRQRETEGGWLLAIYAKGTAPTGLRQQVTEAAA